MPVRTMNPAIFLSVLLVTLTVCSAIDDNPRSFNNTQLTCMVPTQSGESVPEERLRLEFQPGEPGTVWLPVKSGFDGPSVVSLDGEALLEFLAEDAGPGFIDLLFTSTTFPFSVAPLAAEQIPVEGSGSGGFLDSLFPVDDLPEPPIMDPDLVGPVTSFIRSAGLGRCDLSAEWIDLGDCFFPRYYAGSKCTNQFNTASCSFPEGLQCEPDISTPNRIAYVKMLRWDCCWSWDDKVWKWVWLCGWRKVDVPIIVDCTCACNPGLP